MLKILFTLRILCIYARILDYLCKIYLLGILCILHNADVYIIVALMEYLMWELEGNKSQCLK